MTRSDGVVLGMTPVLVNGPRELLLNIVLVPDGFQQGDIAEFAHAVDRFCDALLAASPFNRFGCGINVFRVDVASTDRGGDQPAECFNGYEARTYFDASFCAWGVPRGMSVDEGLVLDVVSSFVPQWHLVIVLVNSDIYGGTGGTVAKVSYQGGSGDWRDVMIHEMGHSLFGLADEYQYLLGCGQDTDHDRWPSFLGIRIEPAEPNITIWRDLAGLKWRDLVADSTLIPTQKNLYCTGCGPRTSPVPAGTVGTFEGAGTYHCDVFRPEFTCRMRDKVQHFCAVCDRVATATLAPFHRAAVSGITARMMRMSQYASAAGFVGGIPTFDDQEDASGLVHGGLLLIAGAAERRDVPSSVLGDPRGVEVRFAAVDDFGVSSGFAAGYPTFVDSADGTTLGCVLLTTDAADVVFLTDDDLGTPGGLPERFRAVNTRAIQAGYVGGFPTLAPRDASPDGIRRCVFVKPAAGTARAVATGDYCSVGRRPLDAAYVGQDVPTQMIAGQLTAVRVTMQNIGTQTWTPASAIRLGSQEPQDTLLWGIGRVEPSLDVQPGGTVTFQFTVTPPSQYGTHPFRWRMLQEGVTWFGDFTQLRRIKVKLPGDRVTVPDVRELRTPAAVRIVRESGLVADTPGPSGSNSFVTRQQPEAGAVVDRGSSVRLLTQVGNQP